MLTKLSVEVRVWPIHELLQCSIDAAHRAPEHVRPASKRFWESKPVFSFYFACGRTQQSIDPKPQTLTPKLSTLNPDFSPGIRGVDVEFAAKL